MKIITAKYLLPKGFSGIALFPFIVLKNAEDKHNQQLLNHEKIHVRQQLEMLVIPFFIWYGAEYLFRLIQYKNKRKAYRNISFEREAYANEANLHYLKKRTFFSFLNYLSN